ncbi:hypothetical protein [Burkholderia pseudomallei]|uniref:hypothetical protein n=1 Tax=Burkholderia pseudomallei TaxID=28450 RepID=UPI000530DCDB|nr:hypothetical protein [Burkholderia pseudomallei]KGS06591.1 hypothetical protein X948_6240 [Burkholderia pseudomallei MSHR5608]KGW88303.1 hypothetical protein Y048_2175 [Burkholderia pseudomallei MSHR456]KKB66964.1 hypothetical protein BBMA_2322 [Burkholderia pseudomallei MSHR1079]
MPLMRQLKKSQRIALFCGLFIALSTLLAHNPLDGYVTEVTWTVPPSSDCPNPTLDELKAMSQADIDRNMVLTRKFCGGYESRALPLSQWTSTQPMIGWLGNLVHLLAAEVTIAMLTALWIVLV